MKIIRMDSFEAQNTFRRNRIVNQAESSPEPLITADVIQLSQEARSAYNERKKADEREADMRHIRWLYYNADEIAGRQTIGQHTASIAFGLRTGTYDFEQGLAFLAEMLTP